MTIVFEIITAVGSLATFGAFVMLFKKDKDKQSQIEKLTSIALTLENQAESLNRQNDLLAQQVDIFRNTSILRGQDEGAMRKLQEIEEKKLRLSVRPNLWLNGTLYKGQQGELQIDLNNKGENTTLTEFRLNSEDVILHSEHLPFELDKGERRYIFAKTIGKKHIKDCKYEIDVFHKDALNNIYISKIIGTGGNAKLTETIEE